jgi:hypothetical protein
MEVRENRVTMDTRIQKLEDEVRKIRQILNDGNSKQDQIMKMLEVIAN